MNSTMWKYCWRGFIGVVKTEFLLGAQKVVIGYIYLKEKCKVNSLMTNTAETADWVSVLLVKKDLTDSVKLCFGWWDLRKTLIWWKFRILFHRKAVRPKTKASSSALIRDCRQWVRKSCLHLQVHSLQALWAQVVMCQSPLWRQTCRQIRWSSFGLLVRKVFGFILG